jgi:hypothetical protein
MPQQLMAVSLPSSHNSFLQLEAQDGASCCSCSSRRVLVFSSQLCPRVDRTAVSDSRLLRPQLQLCAYLHFTDQLLTWQQSAASTAQGCIFAVLLQLCPQVSSRCCRCSSKCVLAFSSQLCPQVGSTAACCGYGSSSGSSCVLTFFSKVNLQLGSHMLPQQLMAVSLPSSHTGLVSDW